VSPGRWLFERRLVLATGIAAALPFLASAVDAVVVGWTPYGDDAVIGTRSLDVFTHNSPLVGQWSSGPAEVVGSPAYTPGPMLYWLLSLPARFLPVEAMPVTIALVNVAATLGTVALARRRGGRPLMFATAVAIPLMLASLPAQTYNDVWNPSVPLPSLMLLTFLAWSLGCGEHRLLPVTVLVGSFVVATHLSYAPPALAVIIVGLAGLVVWRRSSAPEGGPSMWPWVMAAVLMGLACWTPPVIDEVRHNPGNLAVLRAAATADEPKLGLAAGARAVVHTVGAPPWWLQAPRQPLERIVDVSTRPGGLMIVSALLAVSGLAAITLLGLRRRRHDVVVAGLLGLTALAAVAVEVASTPTESADALYYTLRWASVAGMFVWLVVGWSLGTLLAGTPLRAPHPRLVALGVAATAAVAGVVAFAADPPTEPYRPVRAATDRVVDDMTADGAVRVDSSGGLFLAVQFQAGIVYSLRRDGHKVVAPGISNLLGRAYANSDYERLVRVDVDGPPPPGTRLISRQSVRDTYEPSSTPKHIISVSALSSPPR
jgi:hypothetical protein